MANFQLDLTGFEFPRKLPKDSANFRFIVDLRYIDEEGEFVTEHAVMPSLDTFWECAPDKPEAPNYVRADDDGIETKLAKFDMKKIDEWDRLILHVQGKSLHSIQFKVIDVDRKDAWDTVKNVLGKIAETVIGKASGFILKQGSSFHKATGAAADDVQSFLLKKLAGGDKVLFRGSTPLNDGALNTKITGSGTEGNYTISFNVARLEGR